MITASPVTALVARTEEARRDESGVSAIEYALLAMAISVAALGISGKLKPALNALYATAGKAVTNASATAATPATATKGGSDEDDKDDDKEEKDEPKGKKH